MYELLIPEYCDFSDIVTNFVVFKSSVFASVLLLLLLLFLDLPKFFIFQCCRGSDRVAVANVPTTSVSDSDGGRVLPLECDFLVSFATVFGR